MDYYQVLEVAHDATDTQIRLAFGSKALHWHPQKVARPQEFQVQTFQRICEAFEVLSDGKKRVIYDQFGIEELNIKISSGQTDIKPIRSPEEVFTDFFGTSNPFAASLNEMKDALKEKPKDEKKKGEPTIKNLYCSLEELYSGCVKKAKLKLQRVGSDGKSVYFEERNMSIHIKPGWKNGTKITFKDLGDEAPGVLSGDLVFVLQDKPHPRFQRQGDDLLYTANITLKQALIGCSLDIETLDGRVLTIPIHGIVNSHSSRRIPNEGMKSVRNLEKKGDMLIQFAINFPSSLSEDTKYHLQTLLP